MKKVIIVLLIFTAFSCGIFQTEEYEFKFINHSSHDVTITPSDIYNDYDSFDGFEAFTIAQYETYTVTREVDVISFEYEPTEYVFYEHEEEEVIYDTITFDDITGIFITNNSSFDLIWVKWNGVYIGEDEIWLQDNSGYAEGIKSGNTVFNWVIPGEDYITFWFTTAVQEYRYISEITILENSQREFEFTDETLIEPVP